MLNIKHLVKDLDKYVKENASSCIRNREAILVAAIYGQIAEFDDNVIRDISEDCYLCDKEEFDHIWELAKKHPNVLTVLSILKMYRSLPVVLNIMVDVTKGTILIRIKQ